MKLIVSIDPGAKGAAAFFHGEDLTWIISFQKDPDWRTSLFSYCKTLEPAQAYLEEVHSFPGQGTSSMFSFGRRFGEADTVLHLAKCPTQLIQPQEWQRRLGLLGKDKKANKELALKLFPRLANAKGDIYDAVLIGWAHVNHQC